MARIHPLHRMSVELSMAEDDVEGCCFLIFILIHPRCAVIASAMIIANTMNSSLPHIHRTSRTMKQHQVKMS
jgi:hypothetical protein